MPAWIIFHFIQSDYDTKMWYLQATMWYIHVTMYFFSSSYHGRIEDLFQSVYMELPQLFASVKVHSIQSWWKQNSSKIKISGYWKYKANWSKIPRYLLPHSLNSIKKWYKVQTKAPVSTNSKVCNITRRRVVWTIALDHIHNPLISYLFEHYHLNLRNQPISYLRSQCSYHHQGERISFTFITNKPATSIQYKWTT